jgi:thymidylate synthase (FAD)
MPKTASPPEILILSRPRFDNSHRLFLKRLDASWEFSPDATEAERLIEFAGRVCYLAFGPKQHTKGTAAFIHKLIRHGHDSVLEHAVWSFLLTGVSRSFSHQMVRHRVGFSFSQLSQQYHDESGFELVMPADIDAIPGARATLDRLGEAARDAYTEITEEIRQTTHLASAEQRERLRAFRSLARSVLPNATETKLVVTANARALRHFFKLRGTVEGDLEMRVVSALMLAAIAPDAPSVFSDFTIETSAHDGSPILRLLPTDGRGEP